MGDNTAFYASPDPASPKIADDEVPYSGDTAKVQIVQLGSVAGSEGSRVLTKHDIGAIWGATNETAPTNDTAAAGLNGRLQRIAQNLTAMGLQLPASLGAKTKANSLSVTLASDQGDAAARPIFTRLSDGTNAQFPAAAVLGEAVANPTTTMLASAKMGFNGTSWDRWRVNHTALVLSMTARTALASASFVNYNASGIIVVLYVQTSPGAGKTLQLFVQGVASLAGTQWSYTAFPAVAMTSTTPYAYVLYPGINPAAIGGFQAGTNTPIGRDVVITVNPSDASSWTYAVEIQPIQ